VHGSFAFTLDEDDNLDLNTVTFLLLYSRAFILWVFDNGLMGGCPYIPDEKQGEKQCKKPGKTNGRPKLRT
jgi:hypothetical protein